MVHEEINFQNSPRKGVQRDIEVYMEKTLKSRSFQ